MIKDHHAGPEIMAATRLNKEISRDITSVVVEEGSSY